MKYLILLLLPLIIGCANVKIDTVTPDGRPISASYTRWWNQNLEGLAVSSPEGWEFKIDKQKSDLELAFEAGAASVSVK